jgi:hypothetical protein
MNIHSIDSNMFRPFGFVQFAPLHILQLFYQSSIVDRFFYMTLGLIENIFGL